jgi:hypothetical protein
MLLHSSRPIDWFLTFTNSTTNFSVISVSSAADQELL